MGSLFKAKTPKATSTSSVQVPEWLDSRNQNLAARADTLSQKAFTPYTGQRVAGFNADSNQAFDLSRQNVGKYGDLLNTASTNVNLLSARANGPSAADIQSRMNPYLQNVLDVARRKTIDEGTRQQQDLKRRAGLAGAFGGSRFALAETEQNKNLMQALDDLQYKGLFDAFNQAQNQYNTDTNVLGSSIQAALQTAGTGQQMDTTDIETLLRSGELQRLQNQDVLDTQYEEFNREQAYPYEQLNFLSNILNPQTDAYRAQTTTSTQSGGGGSTAGKILGTAASVASLFRFSDERVKENIEQVGELDNGLPVYKFNYKGSPKTVIGLMAQDVEKDNPEAVAETEDGIKMVDYNKAAYASGGEVQAPMTREQLAKVLRQYQMSPLSTPQTPSLPSSGDDFSSILGGLGGGSGGLKNLFSSGTDVFGNFSLGNILGTSDPIMNNVNSNISGFNSMFKFKDGGNVRLSADDPALQDILKSIKGGEEKMTPAQAAAFTADLIKQDYGTLDLGTGNMSKAAPELDRAGLLRLIDSLQSEQAFADGGEITPRAAAQRAAARINNNANTRTPILFDEEELPAPAPVEGVDSEKLAGENPLIRRMRAEQERQRQVSAAAPKFVREDDDSYATLGLKYLGDKVNEIPAVIHNIPSNLREKVYGVLGGDKEAQKGLPVPLSTAAEAAPLFNDLFLRSAKDVKEDGWGALGGQRKTAGVREDISNFVANRRAPQASVETPAVAATDPDIGKMSTAPQGKSFLPGELDLVKHDLMKIFKTSEEKNKREKMKGFGGREVNTPLLMAGIAMMTGNGDFFDQAGAGLKGYVDETNRLEDQRLSDISKSNEMSRDALSDYIDIMKTEAYIDQVAKQGEMTEYQRQQLVERQSLEVRKSLALAKMQQSNLLGPMLSGLPSDVTAADDFFNVQ